ncbi:MAG: DUF4080 domain-containing protein [Spirochaetota bacterium]
MKTVFLGINARYSHSNLALRYLREMIADLPVTAVLREYSINSDILDVAEDMRQDEPDVIILSAYIWNISFLEKLIPLLRILVPRVKIIAGGPEISYRAREWSAQFPQVDAVICGAGESAFRALARSDFISEAKIISGENIPFPDIPFPYRGGFDGMENRYIYYESSRGCPFSCSYCLSSRCDQPLEFLPLDRVFSECDLICAQKVQLIKFVDRSFNADPARAREIWRYFIERNPPLTVHCELHPMFLQDEDFALLKGARAGLFQFEIGVQSTHKRTLAEVGRPVEWSDVRENIVRLCAMKNIRTHLDLIAGLPHEDISVFAESFDNVLSCRPDHFQMGFLKALYGTSIRGHAQEYGLAFTPFPPYQILSDRWMSAGDISLLRRIEQLVETVRNSHRFDGLLEDGRRRYGGYFVFFKELSHYCAQSGFDIETKNEQRLRAVLTQMLK